MSCSCRLTETKPVMADAIMWESPLPYEEGILVQEHLWALRAQDAIPDTVLFLEHPPVVTVGRHSNLQNVLLSPAELSARGVAYHVARRGGDATFHGPGQLVMYPILHLGRTQADLHGYLYNLEEVAIQTCRHFGVTARRREGKNGAWTERGKVAAIGFQIKRGITLHGMSFNVSVDKRGFDMIIPCGLRGEPIASLRDFLAGETPSIRQVQAIMAELFSAIFDRPFESFKPGENLSAQLRKK